MDIGDVVRNKYIPNLIGRIVKIRYDGHLYIRIKGQSPDRIMLGCSSCWECVH